MKMIFQWCFLKSVLFPGCGSNITSFYSISVKQNLPTLLKSYYNPQMSCLIHKHQYYISLVLNSGVQITFIILNASRYLIVWEATYSRVYTLAFTSSIIRQCWCIMCSLNITRSFLSCLLQDDQGCLSNMPCSTCFHFGSCCLVMDLSELLQIGQFYDCLYLARDVQQEWA